MWDGSGVLRDVLFVGVRLVAGFVLGVVLGGCLIATICGGLAQFSALRAAAFTLIPGQPAPGSPTDIALLLTVGLAAIASPAVYLVAQSLASRLLALPVGRGAFEAIFGRVLLGFGIGSIPAGLSTFILLNLWLPPDSLILAAVWWASTVGIAIGALLARDVMRVLDSMPAVLSPAAGEA